MHDLGAMLERAVVFEQPARVALGEWIEAHRTVLVCWAASRAIVFAGAFALHVAHGPRGYFGAGAFHSLLGPLEAWDGVWYQRIALHGYLLVPGRQSDPAFFPLYSVLLKLVGVTGLPVAATAVLLSNLVFLAALLAFDAFTAELFDRELARRATVLLAVFPTTYVCSMIYPESLVLFVASLTGLLALRGRWSACAATAAVAALARPEGILLALPILGCLVEQWRSLRPGERARGVGAVVAGPTAALSFPLYLGWSLHNPLAWSAAQAAWGRSFRVAGIYDASAGIAHQLSSRPWAYRDFLACTLTLVLLMIGRRVGAPSTWIVLGAAAVLVPLGSGSFESDARFALPAFPVYWALAWLCRRRSVFTAVTAGSALLLGAATVTLPLVFP